MDQPGQSGGKSGIDMSKLSTGDMITGGGAIAYLLSVFIFSWYTVMGQGFSDRTGLVLLAILAALAAIVEIGIRVFAGNTLIPNYKQVHMGLAIGAVIITALKVVMKPGGGLFGSVVGLGFGIFVSLVLAVVWAFGAITMKGESSSKPAAPPMGGGDSPIA